VLGLVIAGAAVQCTPNEDRYAAIFWGDELSEWDHIAPLGMSPGSRRWSSRTADLSGDGRDDLVLWFGGTLTVRLAPDFDEVEHTEEDIRPSAFSAGDVDRDGRADLAVARGLDLELISLEPGGWTVIDSTRTSVRLGALALGDLDDNGFLDVVGAPASAEDGVGVLVVPTDATGGLGADGIAVDFPLSGGPCIQDFDGDGIDDALTPTHLVFGDADRSFESVPVPIETEVGIDVDDDGDLDLVVFGEQFEVSMNLDGRSFAAPQVVGGDPDELVELVAVVNPDGGSDKILTYESYRNWARVYGGDGDGGLAIEREIALPDDEAWAAALVSGDFDGDGNFDLLYEWAEYASLCGF
jgi:hypothetical protein